MLHPIILAGSVTPASDGAAGVCPLHFEGAPGILSRFEQLLSGLSGDVFAAPTVVTTQDCADVALAQAERFQGVTTIVEPEDHKPAAALLSALLAMKDKPGALVVVCPATMDFDDPSQFDRALCHAIPSAQRGEIVMLGKRTERAYTGYGTMELAAQPRENAPVYVTRVLPSGRQTTWGSLFHDNHQLWGLGIYIARVDTLLAAFKAHASRLFLPVKNATQRAVATGRAILLDNGAYRRVKAISFEKAVAQKADNLVAIQLDPAWSATGEWDQDAAAERRSAEVDYSAWDADLAQDQTADYSNAADMMAVYQSLATATEDDALVSRSTTYDWGRQETLAMGPGFTLQRLLVHPGESVELTAGNETPEHWIVVQGSALVTLGAHVRLIWESQSARIPAGRSRRVENPGSSTLHMIQLQVSTIGGPSSLRKDRLFTSPAGVA